MSRYLAHRLSHIIPPLHRNRYTYYPEVFPELLLRSDFWPSPSPEFHTNIGMLYMKPSLSTSISFGTFDPSPLTLIQAQCMWFLRVAFSSVSIQQPHESPISLNRFWDNRVSGSPNNQIHAQLLITSCDQQQVVIVNPSKDNLNFFHHHTCKNMFNSLSCWNHSSHIRWHRLQISKCCWPIF